MDINAMSDSTLGQLSWPTWGCLHIFKRLLPSSCHPTEHRRPGENVWEMLPAPLHRGQQQFPGQLVLGHLWNQGNQGAGSALPGLQVLVGRGDAGRNDVRVGGHELQRLDAQNPPNQVGRNGDWRRLKTDVPKRTNELCPSAVIKTDRRLSWCWARSSQPGQEEVRMAVSTRKHSPSPPPCSIKCSGRLSLSIYDFLLSFLCAAGCKTAWSSLGRTATHSGPTKTLGSTVF